MITRGSSTVIIQRWIIGISLSPGKGYFHAFSVGCPTLVEARYISPTLRWSCLNVAIFFESGDQRSVGLSLLVQPALSVAYPKSLMPSVVNCFCSSVFVSRTHKL